MDSDLIQKKLNLDFSDGLNPNSRVWVYHADRVFTSEETLEINKDISDFCTHWVSHNRQLKARGKVLFDRILLLMVDESMAGASGCSIDSSVAFVKNVGQKYRTNLFDRMLITYIENDNVNTTSLHDLKSNIGENVAQVVVFDNLIKTKQDLMEQSLVPIKGSWVERFI